MGYNIWIGNATPVDVTDDEDELVARFSVALTRHEDGPHDNSPTDFTNARWPSYSGWHRFAEATGLEELFFCKGARSDARTPRMLPTAPRAPG